MASSDSEGFESADEGHNTSEKTPRKHRKSSSNYGDSALETAAEAPQTGNKEVKSTDGWEDFDIDEPGLSERVVQSDVVLKIGDDGKKVEPKAKASGESSEQGWDDFDDWSDERTVQTDLTNIMAVTSITNQTSRTEQIISGPSNRTSGPNTSISGPNNSTSGPNTSTSGSMWGWGGWGMDSLLCQATAGITSLTNQVSAGITTVLETGMGIPDAEELANRPHGTQRSLHQHQGMEHPQDENKPEENKDDSKMNNDETTLMKHDEGDVIEESDAFPFGNILKMVGTTGSKVLAGGLDTLETIGRKTMEVLQEGDPGLANKRAMIGLSSQRPVLSVLLREAAARADDGDALTPQHHLQQPKVHYENLFDQYQGLVHLEALEMLSRQVSLRIEERLQAASSHQRQEMTETMAQVEELCELPDDDDEEEVDGDASLLDRLHKATEDLGVKLQFQPLVKHHSEVEEFLKQEELNLTSERVFARAICALAEATALAMEMYHKVAEMLLVKPRRSTADEADSLLQVTVVLTKHTSELARLFTDKLNATCSATPADVATNVNGLVTNVFLEAENSSKYLQNALVLELPIVQIGAFGKM